MSVGECDLELTTIHNELHLHSAIKPLFNSMVATKATLLSSELTVSRFKIEGNFKELLQKLKNLGFFLVAIGVGEDMSIYTLSNSSAVKSKHG